MKYLDDLIFWVEERERIRIKKEAGDPQPWTNDPVLATYRFCNVDRNDDRVTKWIHQNWMFPNAGHPNLSFAMGVARMVNLPETLEELGYPYSWDPHHFISILRTRKERGDKVWTSAYMITGGYSAGGETKEVIIARVLDGLLKAPRIAQWDSLAVAHSKVQVPGIGSFLGAQIVADLKMSTLLTTAKDWWTWCAPGPGSQLGLSFLHKRDNFVSDDQFIAEVNEVRDIIEGRTNYALCAQNTQNCLCEFSKYIRAKYFGKRLKSTYRPANPRPATLP